MKKLIYVTVVFFLFSVGNVYAQKSGTYLKKMKKEVVKKENSELNTYVIEREVPKAGELNKKELTEITQTSNEVLKQLGPDIKWMHSYVTENKVYCVYKAKNKELLVEHAKKGGFPSDHITELASIIDPSTADK
ncbi:MAG: DUF4242 domain-containing protein [Draconibacterium sp.]|nr:DUF4242 domain-containing protein [Draconibacterium sp.]